LRRPPVDDDNNETGVLDDDESDDDPNGNVAPLGVTPFVDDNDDAAASAAADFADATAASAAADFADATGAAAGATTAGFADADADDDTGTVVESELFLANLTAVDDNPDLITLPLLLRMVSSAPLALLGVFADDDDDECDSSFGPSPFPSELAALEFGLEPIILLTFLLTFLAV